MRVRRQALSHGLVDEIEIGVAFGNMEQCHRQHSHQRSVPILTLTVTARQMRRVARFDAGKGAKSLNADVKYASAGLHIGRVMPTHEAVAEVDEIECRVLQKRHEQAQRLRAVIGPSARIDTRMTAAKTRRWQELDQLRNRDASVRPATR